MLLIKLLRFAFSKKIVVPAEKLDLNFSRSSGPGGQNVNKVNTKAEIRFHVPSCDWIPEDVKKRLFEEYPNKINNEGYFIVVSQEHRTQDMNKKESIKKLQEIIDIVSIPKKERVTGPIVESLEEEEHRIKEKKRRSETKKLRTNVRDDTFRL